MSREDESEGNEFSHESHGHMIHPSQTIKYFGSTRIDQRCSPAVTSWVMAEVKVSSCDARPTTMLYEGGVVTGRDSHSQAVLFQHKAQYIIRLSRSTFQECTFAYLMRNKENSRFYCYVFEAGNEREVQSVFLGIRDSIREAYKQHGDQQEDDSNASLMKDGRRLQYNSLISETDSSEIHYDVHYIGRLRVAGPHGSKTLVDEVLQTIRRKQSHRSHSLPPGDSPRPNFFFKECRFTVTSRLLKLVDTNSHVVYLQKPIVSVSYCAQGLAHHDHVAVICREPTGSQFYCYIIHRPYPDTVEPLLRSLREVFTIAYESSCRRPVAMCDSCPMQQLHSLCHQMSGVSVEIGQNLIHKVVQSLPETEFSWIQQKFQEHKGKDSGTQNVIMVSLLRAVYEKLQLQHTHKENAQTPSHLTVPSSEMSSASTEMSSNGSKQKLRGMSKFKESLAHSLENLLSRKEKSRNQRSQSAGFAETNSQGRRSPLVQRRSSPTEVKYPGDKQEMHATVSPRAPDTLLPLTPSGSPKGTRASAPIVKMMKQVSTSQGEKNTEKKQRYEEKKEEGRSKSLKRITGEHERRKSWRHSMYVRARETETVSPLVGTDEVDGWLRSPQRTPKKRKKTREDYRRMWKDAIEQQIMLNRMQKMNKDFDDQLSAAEEKRHKLFYDGAKYDKKTDEKHVHQMLDVMVSSVPKHTIKREELAAAVLQGIPKSRREELWFLFTEVSRATVSPSVVSIDGPADMLDNPSFDIPSFDILKEGQTEYQQAIFIDINRTYPQHPYFKKSSGRGQTALYNVLRAYSVYDREVGYCQGLSFIAGLFIIHCKKEKDAFCLLQRFMMDYSFRDHYMPSMAAIQVRLYQLSRLLHDFLPLVYDHLDTLNIPPFVYAAPWMLTLFACHFPLHFAARVMDFILLDGINGMFKIILSLMKHFGLEILSKLDFESTTHFLKDEIPRRILDAEDQVVNEAMKTDVEQQLAMYDVEYNVLKEALPDEPMETVDELKEELSSAKNRVEELECELERQCRRVKAMETKLNRETTEKLQLAQQLRQLQQHLLEHGLAAHFSDNRLIVQPVSSVSVLLTQQSDEDTTPEGNNAVNSHN